MTTSRYPTAVEREAAKRNGADPTHPADGHRDPLAAQVANLAETAEVKTPRLKCLGGSASDKFNSSIVNATLRTTWVASQDQEADMSAAIVHALSGIAPQDELEGMLACQLVAMHQASLECLRRATLADQTFEGRDASLNQANKASRTFTILLETLNRHRSKGQQRVVVEHVHRHVHVHESGAAIVGTADASGSGGQIKKASQPHEQRAIAYALEPALRSENEEREPMPMPSDEGARSLQASRGRKSRRPSRAG